MKPEELFRTIDDFLEKVFKILEQESKVMHANGFPPQMLGNLRQGVVNVKGILRPLASVEHRLLIDSYEIVTLDNFINLSRMILKNKENPITQFSLRTVIEMGFKRTQILFSESLSKDEIENYKLVVMLGDYGFISPNHPENIPVFKKLLRESGTILTLNQKNLFNDYINFVNDRTVHMKNTKKIRKLMDSVQDAFYKKTPILKRFKESIIEVLSSSFSHIIHGDILLLIDVLESKRPNQLILRVYWVILLTTFNTASYVSSFLKDNSIKDKVTDIEGDFDNIMKIVQTNWEKI